MNSWQVLCVVVLLGCWLRVGSGTTVYGLIQNDDIGTVFEWIEFLPTGDYNTLASLTGNRQESYGSIVSAVCEDVYMVSLYGVDQAPKVIRFNTTTRHRMPDIYLPVPQVKKLATASISCSTVRNQALLLAAGPGNTHIVAYNLDNKVHTATLMWLTPLDESTSFAVAVDSTASIVWVLSTDFTSSSTLNVTQISAENGKLLALDVDLYCGGVLPSTQLYEYRGALYSPSSGNLQQGKYNMMLVINTTDFAKQRKSSQECQSYALPYAWTVIEPSTTALTKSGVLYYSDWWNTGFANKYKIHTWNLMTMQSNVTTNMTLDFTNSLLNIAVQ